jgi:hypothetical protein
MIYMHLLTCVGFGLVRYVPNTSYSAYIFKYKEYKGIKNEWYVRIYKSLVSHLS